MPKFEKKFVHFMWSDELNGKKCFISDYIDDLVEKVVKNKTESCKKVTCSKNKLFPFQTCDNMYLFAYYDPYYELKLAHKQGQKIECKRKGEAWEDWDYTPAPAWLDDHEYRIMPEQEKPITNRELAHWLAQGNGELFFPKVERCCTNFKYDDDKRNEPVDTRFLVRRWDDEEWVKPTREYLGL